ncbi:Spaf_1101 family AAA-like ATPase [Anaerobacillus sp. 1_MG-2023]|uniref:Spaf_1101 family AAA-like ATPase n=1 Tax=Anaerobacillus sp. 1_MG-2023 TaxID=3062655 RepID=UPI0026E46BCE|nr:hypothetical protein [Anaerobacillus sp. 1_MG-2023]MDO6657345.1 hypothetical protein [Anaerobacillus sp. 1_MG-2023]
MINNQLLNSVYESVHSTKISYGHLIKTELHIHTPASFDYELIPGKKYHSMAEKEVLAISIERGLYSEQFINEIIGLNSSEKKTKLVQNINSEFGTDFVDFKEVVAYQLIAHKLYEVDVRAAVISDHNTIDGFKKLQAAIVDYYKSRIRGDSDKKCIVLFLGIEISCSDHYHLVSIFDKNNFNEVEEFVGKYIHSKEEGTYISCLDMVKKVSEQNGIPYIAHINTSDFLGTNLYKKSLFGAEELSILGLTNINKKGTIIEKLNEFQGKLANKYCFLYEGDSHNLNQLGVKNTWIKFNNLNFKSLKKAFKNYEYCIYTEKPQFNDRFIKGMYVLPAEKGFLSDEKDKKKPFIVDFSRDLNCLIGGRGVGKSTVLNILETAFTLEFSSIRYLQFISQHKVIFIVFFYKGNDYILRFLPQTGQKSSYLDNEEFFLKNALVNSISKSDGSNSLAPHWVTLYKADTVDKNRKFTIVDDEVKGEILDEVYKKSYSINSIIERINSGDISGFIKEVVLNGNKFSDSNAILSELNLLNQNTFRKYLRENLDEIVKKVEDRKDIAHQAIVEFNSSNEKLIKIIHSPKIENPAVYIDVLEIHYDEVNEGKGKKNVLNTYLTWDDVENFLYEAIKKFDYLTFLKLLLNKDHKKIEEKISLENFMSDTSSGELDYINSKNIKKVYNQIEQRIFRDIDKVISSIESLLQVVDEFSLFFNVNSKESVSSIAVEMKDIEELSLGQKVVAILTFIFNYGEYSNDNTPLVIDQPEDNLDNLYIYQNLVKSLRKIKNKRQVIVSTHSATIVTNADAEQVIILESDNKRGWLSKKGYPDDSVVLNHIVSILEGGQQSFIHKKDTYKTVLNL